MSPDARTNPSNAVLDEKLNQIAKDVIEIENTMITKGILDLTLLGMTTKVQALEERLGKTEKAIYYVATAIVGATIASGFFGK